MRPRKHRTSGTGGDGSGMVLPVTSADAVATGVRVRRLKKKKPSSSRRGSSKAMWGFGQFLCVILAAGLFVAFLQKEFIMEKTEFVRQKFHEHRKGGGGGGEGMITDDEADDDDADARAAVERRQAMNNLPLKDFSSLQYAFQHSDITLLYFAASWCPMSTPVTERLDELFRHDLLPPPPTDGSMLDDHEKRATLSLVYISSDRNADELAQYRKPNWMAVPFDNEDERSSIKRHFHTCAKREMKELNMTKQRKHEIPTIIVVDSESQQVLTFHGVKDLQQQQLQDERDDSSDSSKEEVDTEAAAQSLIDSWMELKRLSTSLADKYEVREQ